MTTLLEYSNLDEFVDPTLYDMYGSNSAPLIAPKEGKLSRINDVLTITNI